MNTHKNKIITIFEDDHLIIINKPAPFLTIPDRFKPEIPNLRDFLIKKYGNIYTVHRLDKETSGIICFAKTEEAHKVLQNQFENRQVMKKYVALVSGKMMKDEGEIDLRIAPSRSRAGTVVINPKGKVAYTTYKVLKRFKFFTWVEVAIKTGRTHQIRIHMATEGYPLAIDSIYGSNDAFYLSSIKKKFNLNRSGEESPLMSRLTLHSQALTFNHPFTQEKMTFEAPIPKDLRAVLSQLEKHNKVLEF